MEEEINAYINEIKNRVRLFGEKYPRPVSSVYFGGGTPSLVGGDRLCEIFSSIKENFTVLENAEITTEANPNSASEDFFRTIKKGGFNRVSLGLQSANSDELKLLGRTHSLEQVKSAVKNAQSCEIHNISLDLMIGLPEQDESKLQYSIDFCANLNIPHISSYILKIEEGTPFYKRNLILPDEDKVSDLYLYSVSALRKRGYNQYEISNFSHENMESRHNLIYWHCEEYLGIGASAHSFMEGERFYFDRDIKGFIQGNPPEKDGTGGDFEEFAMMALRLNEGLTLNNCKKRFENGEELFSNVLKKVKKIPKHLINYDKEKIALTAEGFLISNAIIGEIVL